MKKLLFIFLITTCFWTKTTAQQRLAFINAKVYTVNGFNPLAEAVVTENGKILFVGSTVEARAVWVTSQTKVVNLKGKLMLPGFIDDHVHFSDGGQYLLGVNLRPAHSTGEFKSILQAYVTAHKGEWILGGNWDHEAWEIKELPTKEMLDSFSPDTPIFVDRFDGHEALANTYALKLAKITKDTPSPDGGFVQPFLLE